MKIAWYGAGWKSERFVETYECSLYFNLTGVGFLYSQISPAEREERTQQVLTPRIETVWSLSRRGARTCRFWQIAYRRRSS